MLDWDDPIAPFQRGETRTDSTRAMMAAEALAAVSCAPGLGARSAVSSAGLL